MSFASLLTGGADCGPSNPLQNAMKGTGSDWSLQRDRFVPTSSSSSSQQQQQQTIQAHEAEQYFMQQQQGMEQRAFDMGMLRQGLPAPRSSAHPMESTSALVQPGPSAWTQEFNAAAGTSSASSQSHTQPQSRSATPGQLFPHQHQRMPFRSMLPHSASQAMNHDLKGKAPASTESFLSNEAWDDAFEQFSQLPQNSNITEEDQKVPLRSEEDDMFVDHVNAQWRKMHDQTLEQSNAAKEMAAWEAQYGAHMDDDVHAGYDLPPLQIDEQQRPFSVQELQEHPPQWDWLSEERTFQDHPDPYEEGIRLLHSGAPFVHVEQAFEEACRRDEHRVEAWTALGEALASDEKEHLAIRALEKAVSITQSSSGQKAQSAWISLAVSYINEGQDSRALQVLQAWLQQTYPSMHSAPLASMSSPQQYEADPWQNHQRMIDGFLEAARAGPAARASDTLGPAVSEGIDADVQLGLGVLLYSNSDYEKARDCFQAALTVRPNDYLLWNRLGATLANGGHPEDAIHAYRTALEMRPNFTRSLYNLAVSCMNISCYKEAAEHLLTALDMQGNNGKGSESDSLWQTLRRNLLCMDRQDLARLALPGADTSQFRNQGFEF